MAWPPRPRYRHGRHHGHAVPRQLQVPGLRPLPPGLPQGHQLRAVPPRYSPIKEQQLGGGEVGLCDIKLVKAAAGLGLRMEGGGAAHGFGGFKSLVWGHSGFGGGCRVGGSLSGRMVRELAKCLLSGGAFIRVYRVQGVRGRPRVQGVRGWPRVQGVRGRPRVQGERVA